jgi:adenylate kinase
LKRRIVLLGPPASGKGTQAELIAARFGIPNVSTGALLREERMRGTALGREADEWIARGRLFPDEIALTVVRNWLAKTGADAFLLDGFPRTLGQAKAFDSELVAMDVSLDAVFHLALADDEIRRRVASRITCAYCGATFSATIHHVTDGDACPSCGRPLIRRGDDIPEALAERLAQHRLHTEPVVEHYRASGCLIEIDAAMGREAIFEKLSEFIEEGVPA